MAYDCFMWLQLPNQTPAIEGETQDSEYKEMKAFEFSAFAWGVSNPSSVGSGTIGSGSGKASFNHFAVTKWADNASPSLFLACACGGHYGEAHVVIRKAGGTADKSGTAYLKFDFKEVFIDDITWSGDPSGSDVPLESVRFSFGACQITYAPQLPTGSMAPYNIVAWSQVLNNNTLAV